MTAGKATDMTANRPEKIANRPEKIANRPEKIANRTEKIANRTEKIANRTEKYRKNRDQINSVINLKTFFSRWSIPVFLSTANFIIARIL
jgi:hypothetical protein